MHVVIFAAGTQGDVRPHAALGAGLQERGHRATLVTSREFAPLAAAAGLGFAPLTADFRAMMQRDRRSIDGRSQLMVAAHGLRRLSEMAAGWAAEGLPPSRGADLIIGSGAALYLAGSIAEALGVPFVRTMLQPIEPAGDITPLLLGTRRRLPRFLNLVLHRLVREATWQLARPAMSGVRRDLGLTPYSWRGPWRSPYGGAAPLLNGFSPLLVPPSRDWGRHVTTTGAWMLRSGVEPDRTLRAFLAAHPKPIYVGFGSMVADPGLSGLVQDAVHRSGAHAVVAGGWAGLNADDARILVLDELPHDWLLPRVSLAVHHCGAGTTAAVAAAGIPSVPVPFLLDQFFWADRLAALGVATPPIRRRALTAERLAASIADAQSPALQARAAALGRRLAQEDGIAAAVDALERQRLLVSSPFVATTRPAPDRELGHHAVERP